MPEILLVGLMVLVAFAGAFALAEWGASHWVRSRLQRQQAADGETASGPEGPDREQGDPAAHRQAAVR